MNTFYTTVQKFGVENIYFFDDHDIYLNKKIE